MVVDNEAKRNDRFRRQIEKYNALSRPEIIALLERNGANIALILDQDEELQMIAIKQNPFVLQWILEPTPSVLLMAKLLS
jgi:hypothetical protein